MTVIECSKSDEYQKLISDGVCIVDFFATWCGPCVRMKPIFKDLAHENPDVKFIQVDLDAARTTMESELADIWTIPTFHAFVDGKMVKHFTGANASKLRDTVGLLNKKIEAKKREAVEAAKTSRDVGVEKETVMTRPTPVTTDAKKERDSRRGGKKTLDIKNLIPTTRQTRSQSSKKRHQIGQRLLEHLPEHLKRLKRHKQ